MSCDRPFADQRATRQGLGARLLARGFRQLRSGALEVTFPDGGCERFGDGVGRRAQLQVLHPWRTLARLWTGGDVGLAEGYMAGDWDTPDLTTLLLLFCDNEAALERASRPGWLAWVLRHWHHRLRRNSRSGSRRNIAAHYDLGNDFYREWLDPSMTYSAALFGEETQPDPERVPLEEAQARKYDRLLERIGMGPGERLLEIGCGWGGLALRAARRGTRVTGLSLSREQLDWAEEQAVLAGLDERIGFCYRDYRDETGTYDGVASVEMFEAVGEQYWPEYFRTLADRLRPGGRAGLQVITIEDEAYEAYRRHPDFIQLYVFPGGMLPTPAHLHGLAERVGLRLREMTPFGLHYAETLRLWQERFNAREQRIRELGYGESFLRLWRYYLSYCEAGFRMGRIDLMQVVLEKPGRAA